MPGTMISRGNIVYQWLISPTLTPVAVAANTTAEQSFTIGGLVAGDFVIVRCNSAQATGIGIAAMRVPAANTLTVGFSNVTAAPVTPTAGVYRVLISRPESVQDLPPSAG